MLLEPQKQSKICLVSFQINLQVVAFFFSLSLSFKDDLLTDLGLVLHAIDISFYRINYSFSTCSEIVHCFCKHSTLLWYPIPTQSAVNNFNETMRNSIDGKTPWGLVSLSHHRAMRNATSNTCSCNFSLLQHATFYQ